MTLVIKTNLPSRKFWFLKLCFKKLEKTFFKKNSPLFFLLRDFLRNFAFPGKYSDMRFWVHFPGTRNLDCQFEYEVCLLSKP